MRDGAQPPGPARGDDPPLRSPRGRPEPPAPDRRSAPSGGEPVRPRDRDGSGRPRNARPRDELGRPLPPGAPGTDRIPDDLSLPPAESLALAQHLIDRGLAFNAHEVLEASWKQAPADERELWRGLAQLAVGLTHAQRGNARGAAALLRRGAERVGRYAGTAPYDIDAAGLSEAAATLAERIETDGLAGLDARLTLTRPT